MVYENESEEKKLFQYVKYVIVQSDKVISHEKEEIKFFHSIRFSILLSFKFKTFFSFFLICITNNEIVFIHRI